MLDRSMVRVAAPRLAQRALLQPLLVVRVGAVQFGYVTKIRKSSRRFDPNSLKSSR